MPLESLFFARLVSIRTLTYDDCGGFLRTAKCKSSQNHEGNISDLVDYFGAWEALAWLEQATKAYELNMSKGCANHCHAA